MSLIRLLTVLTLLPVTATSGLPHVACRCSNGDVHLFCPRLGQPAQKTLDVISHAYPTKKAVHKSCCGGMKAAKCPDSSSRGLLSENESLSTPGCRCAPVYLTV